MIFAVIASWIVFLKMLRYECSGWTLTVGCLASFSTGLYVGSLF